MFRSHQDSSARSAISTLVFFLGGFAVQNLPAMQERCRFGKIPWRRKWQPTPAFLPEKSHGWRSLAGYCPWGVQRSRTLLSDSSSNILYYLLLVADIFAASESTIKKRKKRIGWILILW